MMCDGEKILQARYLFEAVLAGVCGAWARNNVSTACGGLFVDAARARPGAWYLRAVGTLIKKRAKIE